MSLDGTIQINMKVGTEPIDRLLYAFITGRPMFVILISVEAISTSNTSHGTLADL
jgi:hypothetical protein